MKHIVIGTAGHIDHGKTKLTQALTGVDTDRLPAEKAQGITIELGFAPLELSPELSASIVDVPGHEKFVKNMLAGATGIDVALLVVAADDGIMPQTREHLDILRLLGVGCGMVALTKVDLASPEQQKRVVEEIAQLTKGSFLEGAPVIPVSVVTGEGIEDLREALNQMGSEIRGKEEQVSERPLRLPVDRVFTVSGQGTVCTGTLVDGRIAVGDTVCVYPGGGSARVRSLQNHGTACQRLGPGTRTAVLLAGTDGQKLSRGCTIAAPDSMRETELVDVWIQIAEDSPYKIRNNSQLHLYCGTQEGVCKLRLLEGESLAAGQRGYAQLKLAKPMAFRNGDVFVLRFFSPVITIGGGTVLECETRRLKKNRPEVLARLRRLNSDRLEEGLLQRIEDRGSCGADLARLAQICNLAPTAMHTAMAELLQGGAVVQLDQDTMISSTALMEKQQRIQTLLEQWQEEYPLMQGMPLAQLRGQAFEKEEPVELVLRRQAEQETLCIREGFASLPGFEPVFTQEHKIMQRKLLHYYRDAWFAAPDRKVVNEKFGDRALYPQVMRHMLYNRMLVPLTPRYAVHHEAYAEAVKRMEQLTEGGKGVTIGQFRTETGTSRKYAQLFLEHWDSIGKTRRVGDAHFRKSV